jgi:hypothetical protein
MAPPWPYADIAGLRLWLQLTEHTLRHTFFGETTKLDSIPY